MRFDLAFVFWVGSLVLSAAGVVIFLWLMREPRAAGSGKHGARSGEAKGSDKSRA